MTTSQNKKNGRQEAPKLENQMADNIASSALRCKFTATAITQAPTAFGDGNACSRESAR